MTMALADTTGAAPISGMSRRRKAAMVVQMMIAQGRNLSLQELPEEVQLDLTREITALKIIDRDTLHAVADEFAEVLERVGLTAPGSLGSAVEAMSETISAEAAARLRTEEAERRIAANPWAQIGKLENDDIVPIMEQESIEVAAVVLSKLPVPKAAQVLGKLPGDLARRITFAVSKTSGILPGAVSRIGQAIARAHCMKPAPAFPTAPDSRVGAILDSSGSKTREDVLEGLTSDDPNFADQVRKAIFTFADIAPRVRAMDIPNLTRSVNGDTLITAMTFALAAGSGEAESAEFILANMSQRMADQLREDIADRGKIRKAEGEEAMKEVVTAIRETVDAGQMQLIDLDEDEDE